VTVFDTPERGMEITRTFFKKVAGDHEIVEGLKSLNCIVEWRHLNPKFVLCWDVRGDSLEVLDGEAPEKPGLKVIFNPADIGHQIWSGQISAAKAIVTRKIKVQGNVTKLLKITPLQKSGVPYYLKTLKELGYESFIPANAGAAAD